MADIYDEMARAAAAYAMDDDDIFATASASQKVPHFTRIRHASTILSAFMRRIADFSRRAVDGFAGLFCFHEADAFGFDCAAEMSSRHLSPPPSGRSSIFPHCHDYSRFCQ